MRTQLLFILSVLPALHALGCGSEATAPPPISISIAPDSVLNLPAGGTQVFTATLANDPAAKGVTWSIAGCAGGTGSCGSLTNVTSTTTTYTAPTPVPSAVRLVVTAAAVADPTKSATAGISLVPIRVSVSPSVATLDTSATRFLAAAVTNDPTTAGVTWSITGCPSGPPACGSLVSVTTANAIYKAPPVAPPGPVGVTATAIADPSKSATAVVGVVAGGAATNRIAFASYRSFCTEIWTMNADGSNAVQLTGLGDTYCSVYADGAAWSPDGSQIAFYVAPNGNPPPGSYRVLDIFVMNSDGSGVTQLAAAGSGFIGRYDPAWSPDGTKLAATGLFAPCDPRGGCGMPRPLVIVMNPDGSGLTRLGGGQEPAWSPDGTKIAFVSSRDGNYEIYLMNSDGTGLTNLTSDSSWDSGPACSPDGSKIAFRSNRSGHFDLYVMNADGSGVARLTADTAEEGRPAWSPDGRRIAFASKHDGDYEIYIMNADGSGVTQVTNNTVFDGRPAWTR